MTDEKKLDGAEPATEQPTPQPSPDDKLTAAEKRANAARMNAYQELAAICGKLMGPALAVCEAQVQGPQGLVKLYVSTSPADLGQLVGGHEQRLKQLEIALASIVDMLLAVDLVAAIENPEWDKDDPKSAQRLLRSAEVTREGFWLRCARTAEATTSVLTRGLLSQGSAIAGAVGGILRKQ